MVPAYLELLDEQRRQIFRDLAGTSRLWERLEPKKWSVGEHLDHTRVLTRWTRRVVRSVWPLTRPYAWLRQDRPYPVAIDDVYKRPDFPSNTGRLWPPAERPWRPVPLRVLEEGIAAEHRRVRSFYQGKEERLLGQVNLWDPAIGWLNLIQILRVIVYHDAHHFLIIRRQLEEAEG